MRKISKAVLAAGMAAATIASGLSFGAASASAAPSSNVDSGQARETVRTAKGVFKIAGKYYSFYVNNGPQLSVFSNYQDAATGAHTFILPRASGPVINVGGTACLSYYGTTGHYLSLDLTNRPETKCADFTVSATGGLTLADTGERLVGVDRQTGVFQTASTGYGFAQEGFSSAEVIANGGVSSTSGPDATLERGASKDVKFGVTSTGAYTKMKSDVTLTAPGNSRFTAGQPVTGEYTDPSGKWIANAQLDLTNVKISSDGQTLTGTFDAANNPGFNQSAGRQLRWNTKVTANADAPAGNSTLGYTVK
ncbi:hypothetical protein, partial [Curtobacterium sp. Leaf183]|uniref:hypothetical protein n=1 Tax=Curtobacterium sp. Leaf183 TaxID=1736291 RepID=UPI001F1A4815